MPRFIFFLSVFRSGKEERCYVYPGIYVPYKEAGLKEQRMVLTEGPTGCFDGSLHSLMKYFTVILGKVNEHQRPDRDQFITVNTSALISSKSVYWQLHR